jgi:hypothetical protein
MILQLKVGRRTRPLEAPFGPQGKQGKRAVPYEE